ncbi:hypothetical protein A3A39_01550 [Candidatus Kaiserbacteria bacterium RIFCSPLOWO2_01_FULL_54_13]|uniref:Uncharacterized protein n=1 Tax=Candidatus Kaiserbacteria bacterium RIFCSPLOWO2_01_FULL_54_13 TaxID=1798512 RepID=A0A1F6F3Z2_9BACT|nr:MAG: hypothetical protein A3A39_01550 [Candidatus Kaiserbacteria bacterium RIFCSPLOWO2_01_FULL_54_13]
MDVLSKFVCLAFGFKPSAGSGYPCHWCGILTTLLDAEDFHVCEKHQQEYIEIGYGAMKEKYPLAGTDERNPTFFKERADCHVARAKRLTKEELLLIIERGAGFDRNHAQMALDGKTLSENELDFLGQSAEQYIDDWQ